MKLVTLSDHTGTQLQNAEQIREMHYLARLAEYHGALDHLRGRREVAGQALRRAWKDRKVWGLLSGFMEWVAAKRARAPGAPSMSNANRQETVWAAGHEGEQLVVNALKYQLNDAWTVISGYRNRKGEIDLIAVGPDGIIALEIKHLNGLVSCNGDHWYRDKYDRYGNAVERGLPIADKGGRAPSRQLNESTDVLQTFLQQRGVSGYVLRVVVLSRHVQNRFLAKSDGGLGLHYGSLESEGV
jgi:Nuclease-related domain